MRTSRRAGIQRELATVLFLVSLFVTAGPAAAQTHLYVADSAANAVSVIDPATGALTTTIDVGTSPSRVAVAPAASRVYVTNTGSNTVSAIDTSIQDVVATIPVGDKPSGIAANPSGTRVYVLNAAGVVQVIDTSSNAIVAEVPVGGTDGSIAVTADGSRVYVASGRVSVIDAATNSVIASFAPETAAVPDIFNFAVDVAISPDGARAYVAVNTYNYSHPVLNAFSATGSIAVVNTATNTVVQTVNLFSLPGAIALSPDGTRAYAAISYLWIDTGYGAAFFPATWVAAIDTAANAVSSWINLGAGGSDWTLQNRPAGIAVARDGSAVYAAIPRLNALARIDPSAGVVSQFVPAGAGPSGVAVDPDPPVITPRPPTLIDAVNDSAAAPIPAAFPGPVVANVLANDTLGGAPATSGNVTLSFVSATNAGITLDAASGAVRVAATTPAGDHTLTYRICERGHPLNCDTAQVALTVRAPFVIDAVDDHATAFQTATAIANVVGNDTLGGAAAALTTVALSFVSSSDADITLDAATGAVSVAAGAASGDHQIVYRICELASPANCDNGTVTVTVVRFAIAANDDSGSAPRSGGTAIANVLANDTLDGTPATLGSVTLSFVSSTAPGVTLDAATGAVSVAAGAPLGTQSLVYQICQTASPVNCTKGTAAVTVTLTPAEEAAGSSLTSAYVVSTDASLVNVIDTVTNTVAATISVGTAPAQVAIARDGSRVYVTNTGSNSVSVIDRAALSVVATISLAARPANIAVSPSGVWVYVLDAAGNVEVIDTRSDAIVATIPVGGTDGGLAVTPDGSRVYVASGKVSVIDAATNAVIAAFDPEKAPKAGVFNFAVGVAIAPDGARAFVTFNTYDYNHPVLNAFSASGGVAVIDTATNAVTRTIDLFSLPGAIALTPDGTRAYAAIDYFWFDTGYGAGFFPGNLVAAIDTATNAVFDWVDLGADGADWTQQNKPAGIAVTPDRAAVYVAIPRLNTVAVIDTSTSTVKKLIPVEAGPSGVAVVANAAAVTTTWVVDAVNDAPAAPVHASASVPAVANVLANDTIGGAQAAIGNVTLSVVSSTASGITLDANGAVWIAAGTPAGSQTLTYKICDARDSANCDTAQVSLSVTEIVPAVTLGAATGSAGGLVTARVVNGPGTAGDWIGLYDLNGGNVQWQYLNGTQTLPAAGVSSATVTFLLPATPGTFRAELYNATYTLVATSGTITTSAPSITLGSTSGAAGGTVTATVANGPGTAGDWVGLYDANGSAVQWQYLDGTQVKPATGASNATVTFTLPAAAGTYHARFFNAAYMWLATSGSITTTPPAVTLGASTGAAGGLVAATVTNGPGLPGDWVGLYDANGNAVQWQYLNGTQTRPTTGVKNASVTFLLPAAAGTYHARLFNAAYVRVATSATISTTAPSVTVGSTTGTTGGTVTATVTNGPGTAGDWVGLYDANGRPVQWMYLNGSHTMPAAGLTNATVTFALPGPGTYQVRFCNGSYVLVATSETINVN